MFPTLQKIELSGNVERLLGKMKFNGEYCWEIIVDRFIMVSFRIVEMLFGKNKDLIYEDEVVYDVSKRMSELLKKEGVIVHPTLSDPNQKKPVRFLSHRHDKDEQLLVTPRYSTRNSRVGVNMRVYLVNHIYKKLRKRKVPPENIIFISLHGDSLHSSLSGVMVYYPDRRLRRGSFRVGTGLFGEAGLCFCL